MELKLTLNILKTSCSFVSDGLHSVLWLYNGQICMYEYLKSHQLPHLFISYHVFSWHRDLNVRAVLFKCRLHSLNPHWGTATLHICLVIHTPRVCVPAKIVDLTVFLSGFLSEQGTCKELVNEGEIKRSEMRLNREDTWTEEDCVPERERRATSKCKTSKALRTIQMDRKEEREAECKSWRLRGDAENRNRSTGPLIQK